MRGYSNHPSSNRSSPPLIQLLCSKNLDDSRQPIKPPFDKPLAPFWDNPLTFGGPVDREALS